jgi:hypothetical protein
MRPSGDQAPRPGGPEYASPTPALRMGIVSAAESSATGTSINPDAVARLPGCPPPGLARGRLQARAGGSAGGAKRSPPALVDRSSDDTARPQPPLHPVGPSLPLGETFLGLQQPLHTSGLRIRSSRAWLAVRQFGSLTALVAAHGLACAPQGSCAPGRPSSPLHGLIRRRCQVVADDLDDLNGTEGDPQPPQGGELVIVDLRHATIMPP